MLFFPSGSRHNWRILSDQFNPSSYVPGPSSNDFCSVHSLKERGCPLPRAEVKAYFTEPARHGLGFLLLTFIFITCTHKYTIPSSCLYLVCLYRFKSKEEDRVVLPSPLQ
ncbi:hypothetical protein GYMLUDRAFT_551872 [Collybiopsis luxurians FD-317 M1]|uniref:Uncharacterized protein n=1 Tax=Collybiopsis luxurians FD-317 M1 TaxID=944289 RepID=A0A0D0CHL1_9AGAR|nr:hypothetical protein GYMLUDRAFT_551872 [Collybiopsis luxurians FD-317 M1]